MDPVEPHKLAAFRQLDKADGQVDGKITRQDVLAVMTEMHAGEQPTPGHAVEVTAKDVAALAKELHLDAHDTHILQEVTFDSGAAHVRYRDPETQRQGILDRLQTDARSGENEAANYLWHQFLNDPKGAPKLLDGLSQAQLLQLAKAGHRTADGEAVLARLKAETVQTLLHDEGHGIPPQNYQTAARWLNAKNPRTGETNAEQTGPMTMGLKSEQKLALARAAYDIEYAMRGLDHEPKAANSFMFGTLSAAAVKALLTDGPAGVDVQNAQLALAWLREFPGKDTTDFLASLGPRQTVALAREAVRLDAPAALKHEAVNRVSASAMQDVVKSSAQGPSDDDLKLAATWLHASPPSKVAERVGALFGGMQIDGSHYRMERSNADGAIRFGTQMQLLHAIPVPLMQFQTATKLYAMAAHLAGQAMDDEALTLRQSVEEDSHKHPANAPYFEPTGNQVDMREKHGDHQSFSFQRYGAREVAGGLSEAIGRILSRDPGGMAKAVQESGNRDMRRDLAIAVRAMIDNQSGLEDFKKTLDQLKEQLMPPEGYPKLAQKDLDAFRERRGHAAYALGMLIGAAKDASVHVPEDRSSLLKTAVSKLVSQIPKVGDYLSERVANFVNDEFNPPKSPPLTDPNYWSKTAGDVTAVLDRLDSLYNRAEDIHSDAQHNLHLQFIAAADDFDLRHDDGAMRKR